MSDDEIATFKADQAHRLERFQGLHPSFETWRKGITEGAVGKVSAKVSLPERAVESLGAMDALFAFLGVSTAFKIVARAGAQPAPESSRAPPGAARAR